MNRLFCQTTKNKPFCRGKARDSMAEGTKQRPSITKPTKQRFENYKAQTPKKSATFDASRVKKHLKNKEYNFKKLYIHLLKKNNHHPYFLS